ncbi:Bug family tripartite tricarboxylate transporter substrate binding protein [Ramlibacter sp.]|uniref:Bug family tripartite tricarboxylate transporter substrate binding protein n=1 Tax=Ramlibacter sp. TaxID=1917967 RepID=UPI003D09D43B
MQAATTPRPQGLPLRRRSLLAAAAGAPLAHAGLAGLAALGPATSAAQQTRTPEGAWPTKPVHLVIPAAAGAGPDVLSRMLASKLSETWGQPVVVENLAGAGGNIGHEKVAKSTPDGYALLIGMIGPMAINPSLYDKMAFDATRDFTPISMVARYPNMLVVHPSLPLRSVSELIAYAKANPGKLRYGSVGTGTSPHLCGVMLESMAGITMVQIPYKSSAQMTTDAIAGHFDLMFLNPPAILQHVKSGALRALAITSATRQSYAPQVPTMGEAGVPGFELTSWYGLFAPAGTPAAIVSRINGDLARVMARPDVREQFVQRGDEPFGGRPEEASQFVRAEIAKWNRVIKQANIKIE